LGPVIDALWGAGYFNATVTISLGAASLTIASSDVAAFASAAESYRNRAVAPVAIKVDPGPLFRLRSIRVVNAAGIEFSQDELPPRIVGLKPGDPAVASDLRAAEARIIDWFRNQGRPLAKVQSIVPIVDHAAQVMDVTVTADPGPVAPFGEAPMTGPESFDPGIARSFLYIQPGDPYSPRAVQDARTSIRQIPAVGGVRITEGTALDDYGRLPYQIDVEDRLPYAVGGSVQYSTTNGPAGQVYWEDRNVFGGAEQLRLQADIFYAPPWYVTSPNLQRYSIHDLDGRLSTSILKPTLWDTRNIF
jgi:translocation and assembly module TamA